MFKKVLGVACVMLFSTGAGVAQDWGVRYARTIDGERNVIGVDANFDLSGPWSLNPSLEYWLDDPTAFLINGDVNYNFNPGGVNPYIGAGLGVAIFDDSFEEEDLDIGTEALFNINGGIEFGDMGAITPYVQVRYFQFFDEDAGDDIALMAGIRF